MSPVSFSISLHIHTHRTSNTNLAIAEPSITTSLSCDFEDDFCVWKQDTESLEWRTRRFDPMQDVSRQQLTSATTNNVTSASEFDHTYGKNSTGQNSSRVVKKHKQRARNCVSSSYLIV